MKQFSISVFILIVLFGLLARPLNAQFYLKEKTGTTRVYGDQVLLRVKPTLSAEYIAPLPIGKEIEIVRKMEDQSKVEGCIDNWYKVKVKIDYKDKYGYIWGGYLADHSMNTSFGINEEVTLLLVRDDTYNKYEDPDYHSGWPASQLHFRIANEGKKINEWVEDAPGMEGLKLESIGSLMGYHPYFHLVEAEWSYLTSKTDKENVYVIYGAVGSKVKVFLRETPQPKEQRSYIWATDPEGFINHLTLRHTDSLTAQSRETMYHWTGSSLTPRPKGYTPKVNRVPRGAQAITAEELVGDWVYVERGSNGQWYRRLSCWMDEFEVSIDFYAAEGEEEHCLSSYSVNGWHVYTTIIKKCWAQGDQLILQGADDQMMYRYPDSWQENIESVAIRKVNSSIVAFGNDYMVRERDKKKYVLLPCREE